MATNAKKDLATMLGVNASELAAISGGLSAMNFSSKGMSVAASTQGSLGMKGDSTDAKHEHTDDGDDTLTFGGAGASTAFQNF